jgi:hypothetical protein
LGVLFILPLLSISAITAFVDVPSANALTKRDYFALDDQPLVTRYGNSPVCGNHICGPGEQTKMQQELNQAQTGKASSHGITGQTMSDNHSMMSDRDNPYLWNQKTWVRF